MAALAFGERPTKIVLRVCPFPVRILPSRKPMTVNTDGEKRNPAHCWSEFELARLLWKPVWKTLKKLKIELARGPVRPHWNVYLKTSHRHTTEIFAFCILLF